MTPGDMIHCCSFVAREQILLTSLEISRFQPVLFSHTQCRLRDKHRIKHTQQKNSLIIYLLLILTWILHVYTNVRHLRYAKVFPHVHTT